MILDAFMSGLYKGVAFGSMILVIMVSILIGFLFINLFKGKF